MEVHISCQFTLCDLFGSSFFFYSIFSLIAMSSFVSHSCLWQVQLLFDYSLVFLLKSLLWFCILDSCSMYMEKISRLCFFVCPCQNTWNGQNKITKGGTTSLIRGSNCYFLLDWNNYWFWIVITMSQCYDWRIFLISRFYVKSKIGLKSSIKLGPKKLDNIWISSKTQKLE